MQQKIIKHIGVAHNETELIDLKALAASIKYQLEHQEQASLFDNQDIEQIARDKIQKELTQASHSQTQTKTQAQYNDEDYLSNQGYKKYLQLSDNKAKISLNEDKIIQDSQWDGLKGFVVNANSSLSDTEILQ